MKLKSLSKIVIISFLFTVSSFCFGGIFAHAEIENHEHEHAYAIDEEGAHFSEPEKVCCEHEQGEMYEMNVPISKDKVVSFLYLFVIGDFAGELNNNLFDYIHTSSLSPPPEMVALSSVVKRE